MNRRMFLGSLAAAVADPERLLWIQGAKKIFIPPPSRSRLHGLMYFQSHGIGPVNLGINRVPLTRDQLERALKALGRTEWTVYPDPWISYPAPARDQERLLHN